MAVPLVGTVWRAQYVAEWFMEWNASGGIGQTTVDLQVQRPNASTFQTIATGLGPNDEYLFSTDIGGTYVFRAIVRDSRGNTRSDTA